MSSWKSRRVRKDQGRCCREREVQAVVTGPGHMGQGRWPLSKSNSTLLEGPEQMPPNVGCKGWVLLLGEVSSCYELNVCAPSSSC